MNPRDLGNYIRVLRLEHNYSQRKLAEKLTISHQDIQSWEDGQDIPDDQMLMRLAAVFHLTYEELIRGKEAIPDDPYDLKLELFFRNVFFYGGIGLSSLGLSLFYAPRGWFVLHLFIVLVGILLGRLWLSKRDPQSVKKQYVVITSLLVLIAIIMMIVTPSRFFIRTEEYIHISYVKEQLFDAQLGRETEVITYFYGEGNVSGVVYTKDFEDFRVIDFSRHDNDAVMVIDTNDEKVISIVNYENRIYVGTVILGMENDVTTFDYAIYEYDTTTWDRTLIYQSDETFDLYTSTFRMFMVSSYMYGHPGQSDIYSFDMGMEPYKIASVRYTIWDLHETMVEMQTRLVVSVTNGTVEDGYMLNDVILVDDNEFATKKRLVQDLRDPLFFTGDHHYVVGFNETKTYRLDNGEGVQIKGVDGFYDLTYVNEELFYGNHAFYDESFNLIQRNEFYTEDFNRVEFPDEIVPDGHTNFYALDNEFMGFGFQMRNEPYYWTIHIVWRLIYGSLSIITFGLFIRVGQNNRIRKYEVFEKEVI